MQRPEPCGDDHRADRISLADRSSATSARRPGAAQARHRPRAPRARLDACGAARGGPRENHCVLRRGAARQQVRRNGRNRNAENRGGAVMTRESTRRVLITLALEVWGWKRRVLAALVLLLLAKLAAVVVPLVLKRIIDVLSRPEALAALPIALLASYAAVRFSSTLFGELRDLVFAR